MVEQHMGLHAALVVAASGPGKQRQTQGHGGRVQRQQLVAKTEFVLARTQALLLAEARQRGVEQIPIKRGWAMLVGIGQGGLVGRPGNAEMHQLAQTTGQPIADLAQRIGVAQLAKQHGHKLGPAVEALGGPLGLMLFDQAGKLQTRKLMQQLIEQTGYLYHQGRPPQRFQSLLGKVILKPPMPEGNQFEMKNCFGQE